MEILKRHTEVFVNRITPVEFCGKTIGWQMDVDGSYEIPFEIEATEGEHDYNKCESCKGSLNELIKKFKEKFEGNEKKSGFPFCCPFHANLVKVKSFNKASFINVPEMVARKIIYTNQHFINSQNAEDWYKRSTDYIKWVASSFGQMPKGCGEPFCLSDYFFYITHLLKTGNLPNNKKEKILEFINLYQTPKKHQKTDFNILVATYQKWLGIFPFEVSYFKTLKEYFERHLLILDGEPEINIYSGLATAKMHTKSSLIEALIDLTDKLLTEINGVTYYEKGLIIDADKIKIELIINSRKLKLKQGYKNNSQNEEQRYKENTKGMV